MSMRYGAPVGLQLPLLPLGLQLPLLLLMTAAALPTRLTSTTSF